MKSYLIASAVVVSLMAATPAVAESAHEQSVMNKTGVYETTLHFYLHPARLEWRSEADENLGEHPAVLVNRNSSRGSYDHSTKFYRHPATL